MSYLFKDLQIWKEHKKYRNMQGKYPVIFLTFKDVGINIIYNPWSIISFSKCNKDGLRPYWVNTSGNELIKKLIISGGSDVKADIVEIDSIMDLILFSFEESLLKTRCIKNYS